MVSAPRRGSESKSHLPGAVVCGSSHRPNRATGRRPGSPLNSLYSREPTEQSIQRSPSRPAQSIEQVRGWRLELQGQDILHGICVHGICICHCCLVAKSCPTLLQPHGVCQAPLSMGSPRQEYWSGLPFPSPGDLPDPGIELTSPELAGGFFTTEPPWKPIHYIYSICITYDIYHLYTITSYFIYYNLVKDRGN